MDTPLLTRAQCQAVDRHAIDHFGMSGLVLMENAGRGTVDVLERLGIHGPVVIVCGKGNNAGDGFVIARHLEIRGHEPRVVLLGSSDDLKGDAGANYSILKKSALRVVEFASQRASPPPSLRSSEFTKAIDDLATKADWLVDAMLGTGARGEPRCPIDAAIDWMNAQACRKLAVDVPSGLDCDTGEASCHTVHADHTCTYVAMKIGFTLRQANRYTGTVDVCDIGVPTSVIEEVMRGSLSRRQ